MLASGLLAALTLGTVPAEILEDGATGGEAIALRWAAPAGCPDVEQARALVERLAPRAETKLVADARIDAAVGGFVGTVTLPAEPSPTIRRLQAQDCTVLARAMAVVIAVSLDPIAVVEADRVSPVVPVAPNKEASELGSAPKRGLGGDRASVEPRTVRHELEGGLRIGAGVGGLLLPAAGVGVSLAPFLGTARIHLRAIARYWAPQTVAFDPRRDAAGELQLVTGGVRVCPQLEWDRVRIPLCAGADAGAMLGRGTGRDLATPRSARGPWVGAVLEPGVTIGVTSRVSLWLALEGVVSLYRPKFAVEGASWAWTAGAGAVQGLFGVQVHARRNRPQNP